MGVGPCVLDDDHVQLASSNAFSACGAAMVECHTAHLFIGFLASPGPSCDNA